MRAVLRAIRTYIGRLDDRFKACPHSKGDAAERIVKALRTA